MIPQSANRREDVPNVRCLVCADNIALEADTYANYQGIVVCGACKQTQSVVIQNGELLRADRLAGVLDLYYLCLIVYSPIQSWRMSGRRRLLLM